jgi:hypothetical protein
MSAPEPSLTSLVCHPTTPTRAVERVQVTCVPDHAGSATFCFRIEGDIDALRLPADQHPERRGGLWEHTCCEAFLGMEDGTYVEMNFSPNGDWDAYRFSAYRQRETPDPVPERPRIIVRRGPDWLSLEATVSTRGLLGADHAPVRCAGLSAVLEEQDATRSYWSLKHPRAVPDFHDAAGFALSVPPDAFPADPGKAIAS